MRPCLPRGRRRRSGRRWLRSDPDAVAGPPTPMVPWPAMTSGSSKGCTKVRPRACLDFLGSRLRLVEDVTVQHDLAAQPPDGFDLDDGRRPRHDDRRRNAQLARRQRHALGMIARGCADDAALARLGREPDDLVVGSAKLEGEDRLQVLPLEQDRSSQALREPRHRVEQVFRSRRRRRGRSGCAGHSR